MSVSSGGSERHRGDLTVPIFPLVASQGLQRPSVPAGASCVQERSLLTVVPGREGHVQRPSETCSRHMESLWAFQKLLLQPDLAYLGYREASLFISPTGPKLQRGKVKPKKSPRDLPEIRQPVNSGAEFWIRVFCLLVWEVVELGLWIFGSETLNWHQMS